MKTLKLKYLTIFLMGIFSTNFVAGQTLDDTRKLSGVWLYKTGMSLTIGMPNGNLTPTQFKAAYPYVPGVLNPIKWSSIEPSPGVYDWTSFDANLNSLANAGLLINLMMWSGPDCPNWLYFAPYFVDSVVTINNTSTWSKFPYPLDTAYQRRWYMMTDSVAAHLHTLPTNTRNKIVLYQSAEGTTGDEGPYKGIPVNPSYNLTGTDQAYINMKRNMWVHLYNLYNSLTPMIHVLINGIDDAAELAWINANTPNVWRKGNSEGHFYECNSSVTKKAYYDPLVNTTAPNDSLTQSRCRDEYDIHQGTNYAMIPAWHSFWTGLNALHFGIDLWSTGGEVFADVNTSPGFNFFAKYAGAKNPKYSPRAFCALRDGLDANDFNRFPALTYGSGTSGNSTLGQNRCIKIANSFSLQGASQDDPNGGQGGMVNNFQSNGVNDVGWEIFPENYSRYLTQWSPNTTSIGYWRQGDTTQPYGRFARAFKHSANMDTMFFNINDSFFNTFPNNAVTSVTINVTYLDKGTSTWKLMYDGKNGTTGLSQRMTAYTMTNTNTRNNFAVTNINRNQKYLWKTKSIVITNGMFGNNLTHGTDLMLVNNDNTDEMFHMIEIIKGASAVTVSAGFNVSPTICVGQSVALTDASIGATSWNWSMPGGSPASSTLQNPSVSYSSAGTRFITLTVNGSSSITKTISVIASPTLSITGSNMVCSGSSTTLTASGANSYTWMPGNVNANVLVASPSSTTIYTVTGEISSCVSVSTKTMFVSTLPVVTISATSTLLCSGQSATLTASGATSYSWLPNNTYAASISGVPLATADYTVIGSSATCTNSAVQTVSVISNLSLSVTGNATICSGSSTTLTANGAVNYTWIPGNINNSTFVASPIATTVYTLTGSIGSCKSSVSKIVYVNALPNVNLVASKSNICKRNNVTLTASGAVSYTFNPGGITTNPATFNPNLTTNYTVTGMSSNGCKNNAYTTVDVRRCLGKEGTTTGIDEQTIGNSSVLVYPNPANDVLNIYLEEEDNSSLGTMVVLFDITGKELLRQTYTGLQFSLEVKQLAQGIYILKLMSNKKEYVQKVVIQNH